MTIELTKDQLPFLEELKKLISEIDKEMAITIDGTNGDEISFHLMKRINLLASCPRIMELATIIYNYVQGMAAEQALLTPELLRSKQDIQRMWIKGRVAKWDALYVKSERITKDLFHSIEGLRSALSYEKNLAYITQSKDGN